MYTRLMNYITEHKILSNLQFRFRKGYSTEMASSVLTDNISKATDNKEHVIGVFLLRKRLILLIIGFYREN